MASDALPSLRRLLWHAPIFQQLFGELIQISLVIDAEAVQRELRWRLRSRRNPCARSSLHEAIDSGAILAFAPTALRDEIKEHAEEIADDCEVSVDRVRAEWQAFQHLVRFYEPESSQQIDQSCVDPDDLPYKLAYNQLGAQAVYTRDTHFHAMQVPSVAAGIDLACRSYARAASVEVGVTLGTGFTAIVGIHSLTAIAQACVEGFRRLPNPLRLAIGVAAIIAVVHPKCRQTIAGVLRPIWNQLQSARSPLVAAFGDFAANFVEAQRIAREESIRIKSLVPPKRKLSAVVHARAVCVASQEPLSLREIELRMRQQGYATRSRTFTGYLRRIMRADRRFVELATGMWTFQPDTHA
jgi:hypothetical protein